jgi:hypothetical protein
LQQLQEEVEEEMAFIRLDNLVALVEAQALELAQAQQLVEQGQQTKETMEALYL